jgi:indole-3-glycerol phosphate synthase
MSVLERIVDSTRADVARPPRGRAAGRARAARRRHARGPAVLGGARAPGISVIAEHKRRSPSAGEIRAARPCPTIVGAYERGGAAALSILTEGPHFGGSLDDLREARAASALPILRKDFIVDPTRSTSPRSPAPTRSCSSSRRSSPTTSRAAPRGGGLDLDVLVEVHDEDELERALEVVDADVIGINNRDLDDFTVDVERNYELLADVPAGKTGGLGVASTPARRLEELERVGVDAVLIGEDLMRAPIPELGAARPSPGHGARGDAAESALCARRAV